MAYSPTGFEKYGCACAVADYKVNFSVWDTSAGWPTLLVLPSD
ncbi:unnamed protein product [Plutella xylostella]|uniref:(diamondback moth) hypothetical protein n=1 Tax=Plutella xylostella TaxID=51655 RepID=A0A8S4FQC4_PLUXY|nr:unnamed protein product [Plutella xylostella]